MSDMNNPWAEPLAELHVILLEETKRSPEMVRSGFPSGPDGDLHFAVWLLEAAAKYNTFGSTMLVSILGRMASGPVRDLSDYARQRILDDFDLMAALQSWLLSLFRYAAELLPEHDFSTPISFYERLECERINSITEFQDALAEEG